MNVEKVNKTIDECVQGMKEIDQIFDGSERIGAQEHEEKFYKTKFNGLSITPRIVSQIYSYRNNDKEIQEIKKNIDKYLIH